MIDPLNSDNKNKFIRIAVIAIWSVSFLLNIIPIAVSLNFTDLPKNLTLEERLEIKNAIPKSWFAALELGLTLPVFLTIVSQVRLIYLARYKQEKDLTGESKSCKNWSKFEC